MGAVLEVAFWGMGPSICFSRFWMKSSVSADIMMSTYNFGSLQGVLPLQKD
jgi:hypothetical protein